MRLSNSRDIEKMLKNWAQTDEVVVDNPLGGIKRGRDEIKVVYERLFNYQSEYYFEFYDFSLHVTRHPGMSALEPDPESH